MSIFFHFISYAQLLSSSSIFFCLFFLFMRQLFPLSTLSFFPCFSFPIQQFSDLLQSYFLSLFSFTLFPLKQQPHFCFHYSLLKNRDDFFPSNIFFCLYFSFSCFLFLLIFLGHFFSHFISPFFFSLNQLPHLLLVLL